MGQAYIPGLKISKDTLLTKDRILPLKGDVLVNKGESVKAGQTVASTKLPGKVFPLNIVNILNIEPAEIFEYMKKREGDEIIVGEVIAENSPLLKWFKKEIRSPIDGSIESISNRTGQMLLRELPRPLELFAYIDGIVKEIFPQLGVRIECRCKYIQGIFGIGGEVNGELVMGVDSPDETISDARLSGDLKDKIIVCGAIVKVDILLKALELGVKGIITGGIHDKELKKFLGYDLGVAITGMEKIDMTVVITEGFGSLPIAHKIFEILNESQGNNISINGATQIRAGVIRPEIIIPIDTKGKRETDIPLGGYQESIEKMATLDSNSVYNKGLSIGDEVRIIRYPYFGKIGILNAILSTQQTIATESITRVVEISFKDGTTRIIPLSNIELIE